MAENLGNCKDCRHWLSAEARWKSIYGVELDDAERADAVDREIPHECVYGECVLSQSSGAKPSTPNTRFYAQDTDAYHATLRTLPDFGCNQFERKEQQ